MLYLSRLQNARRMLNTHMNCILVQTKLILDMVACYAAYILTVIAEKPIYFLHSLLLNNANMITKTIRQDIILFKPN